MADQPAGGPDSSLYVLRELDAINRRIDSTDARVTSLDEHGSRGLSALQVQLTELAKDMATLDKELTSLDKELKRSRAARWAPLLAYAGMLAPLYGFLIEQAITRH